MGLTTARRDYLKRRATPDPEEPLKTCSTCNVDKPLSAFHKRKSSPDGRYDDCRDCRRPAIRAVTLFRAYGMTVDEYDAILAYQDGVCAICHGERSYGMGAMGIDHDHACCGPNKGCPKCIRGLLCNRCNILLGWMDTYGARIKAHLRFRPLKLWRAGKLVKDAQ